MAEDAPISVVIGGSRLDIFRTLMRHRMEQLPRGSTIHHGDARGVDQTADAIAREIAEHRFHITRYPVTASEWREHGKRAGVLRNERMLCESHAALVLAFWDGLSPGYAQPDPVGAGRLPM